MITTQVLKFRDAFRAFLLRDTVQAAALQPFVAALDALDVDSAQAHADTASSHPALTNLPRTLAALACDADFAAAIRAIVPTLRFANTYDDVGPAKGIARNLVWGEIAGRGGLIRSDQIRLGCFLLAPGMVYPLHGHQSYEIYCVVAGALTVEHGLEGARHSVTAPATSVTPVTVAHAMQVGAEPVLIVYCWTGDLTCPVWWWEKDANGTWFKSYPTMFRG